MIEEGRHPHDKELLMALKLSGYRDIKEVVYGNEISGVNDVLVYFEHNSCVFVVEAEFVSVAVYEYDYVVNIDTNERGSYKLTMDKFTKEIKGFQAPKSAWDFR